MSTSMLAIALLALTSYQLYDEPLASIAATINRDSSQQIIIADAAASEKRISGYYRGDDLEGLIKAIADLYPDIEVRKVGNGWVIRQAHSSPVTVAE